MTRTKVAVAAPVVDERDGTLTWEPVDRVHAWVKNPRKNAKAVPKVKASIKRFKWGRPLVANCRAGLDGELIIGHTAWLCAQELAKAKHASLSRGIPVFWRDMPASEAHALALADNKSGEFSEWDDDKLAEVFQGEDFSAKDMFATGFGADELEGFLSGDKGKREKGPKDIPIEHQFSVVIECDSEDQQVAVIEWCQAQEYKCRALI